jgi:hypothetical protein
VKKKAVAFGNVMLYVVCAVTKEQVHRHVNDVSQYVADQVQNNDMDRACDADRGEETCIQGFMGNPRGRDHLEVQTVDGRMILK